MLHLHCDDTLQRAIFYSSGFISSVNMKLVLNYILHLLLVAWTSNGASLTGNQRRTQSECQPFHSTFKSYEVTRNPYTNTPFRAVSPEGSYSVGDGGLELYLERPNKAVKTKGGVNDVVAEGATINSTFTIL